MKPDDIEQLKELVAFLKENEIAEFDLDRGDLKVRLKFASAVVAPAAPAAQLDLASLARLMGTGAPAAPASPAPVAHLPVASAPAAPAPVAVEEEVLHILKSPIVGTFYESPSPGAPAFVKVGDQVEVGQVLCIVEAMKLMNEIEADVAGEVVKRIASSGQPVEYGQTLFAIKAR